jgi:curved DNA-binding protein CbpA
MHQTLFPYHPQRDVYRLLQVDATANSDEISAACRRLARTFHPDRNRSPRATEEMQVINAVRDLLTNPAQRAAYDRSRYRFLFTERSRVSRRITAPGASAPTRARTSLVATPWETRPSVPGTAHWVRLSAASAQALAERTLRALVEAFRAAAATVLGPRRCPTCHEVVEVEYVFCAACGSPLKRAARLRGA